MSSDWITTSFIGSFRDEPDEALIVLRGDIDAAAVQRLGVHIADVLEAETRCLRIDAAAVDSYEQGLLDLLGRTQRRLGRHHGMLRVQGLHPSLLRGPAPPGPASPGPAPPDPHPPPPAQTGQPLARPGPAGSPPGAGEDARETAGGPDD